METKYFARLNDDNKPIILYRATPEMEEEVWTPAYGWVPDEFLLDVLEGSGDIYPITVEKAKNSFPVEAFK